MGSILLIRHGQASFGAEDYDALSRMGEVQSRVLGEALLARKIQSDVVISGSMQRHQQTARGCLIAMGVEPEWIEDRGWDEYDHKDVLSRFDPRFATLGAMASLLANEKNPRQIFQDVFSKAMARWTDGNHDSEYKESWPMFTGRIDAALTRLLARLERSQTALIFTSGGAISVVCRKLLGLPDSSALGLNWTIANASVTKLLAGSGGLRLSTFNEHAHFEGINAKLLSYR